MTDHRPAALRACFQVLGGGKGRQWQSLSGLPITAGRQAQPSLRSRSKINWHAQCDEQPQTSAERSRVLTQHSPFWEPEHMVPRPRALLRLASLSCPSSLFSLAPCSVRSAAAWRGPLAALACVGWPAMLSRRLRRRLRTPRRRPTSEEGLLPTGRLSGCLLPCAPIQMCRGQSPTWSGPTGCLWGLRSGSDRAQVAACRQPSAAGRHREVSCCLCLQVEDRVICVHPPVPG